MERVLFSLKNSLGVDFITGISQFFVAADDSDFRHNNMIKLTRFFSAPQAATAQWRFPRR